MADVSLPAIATATPVAGDTLVGVRAGALRRFDINTLSGLINAAISYNAGAGIPYRFRGSDLSATTKNFNFGVANFPGVNLPASARQNTVVSFGWNVASNGAREDTAEANLRIAFEEHYHQGGTEPRAMFEWHLSSFDTSGVEHRGLTGSFPKDGSGVLSAMGIQFDQIFFGKYDGTQKLLWDLASDTCTTSNAFVYRTGGNNYAPFQQRNAANSAYLPLPYVNAENRLQADGSGIQCSGATPTTGTYANVFAAFQASSSPANGKILYAQGPVVTGATYTGYFAGNNTTDSIVAVYNDTNTAASNAVIELRTIGTAAGDPLIRFNVNGGSQWQVGADNSDSDTFKLGTSALGSADKFTLTTGGDLAVAGSVKTASYTVATLPSASALGAGTQIYVSNAAGSACIALSNGTNWKRCDDCAVTVT